MTGDCFEANGKYFLDHFGFINNKRNDVFLCHGYVIGAKGSPVDGTVFVHCWIELGDVFMDYSNGNKIIQRKDVLYDSGRLFLNSILRYTPEEVVRLILKHKTYGYWDNKFNEREVMTIDDAKVLLCN